MNGKTLLRWGASMLLALAVLSGCGEDEEEQAAAGAQGGRGGPGGWGGGRGGGAAIPVKAEKVVRGEMSSYIETYARLEAERQISVTARATGYLQELSVEEGDRVRAGQVLVRLDKEELDLRMRQVQASYNESKANYDRIQVLHENKMVSQAEYETTQLRFENSKVSLEEAKLNLAYADVEAPISGVIMRRMVELGSLVRSSQEMFTIADMDPLLVRIFVPERRMYQLRAEQAATVVVEALPERKFKGRIRMISPEVDPESGTVKVTLEVPADGLLKPGMFSTVRIITESRPNALIIPKKALILETDVDDVFTVEDGKVKVVDVELGFVEGDRVEVVSGLEEGMEVVTVGHEGLKNGSAVRVVGGGQPVVAEEGADGGEWKGKGGDRAGGKGGGQWKGKGGAANGDSAKGTGKEGGGAWQGRAAGKRGSEGGSALPDSLRELIAKYRAEGKELPDSLRAKLRKMRGARSSQ
ncbi:MAG: efflux RND transporter periplasmic adaptor subunit [Candidatus Latescibacterota bacterium]|jgi:membrane fusion protein (multidrug efflux system)